MMQGVRLHHELMMLGRRVGQHLQVGDMIRERFHFILARHPCICIEICQCHEVSDMLGERFHVILARHLCAQLNDLLEQIAPP